MTEKPPKASDTTAVYSTRNNLNTSVSSEADELSRYSTTQTTKQIEPSTSISQTTPEDELRNRATQTTTSIPASERNITGGFDVDKSTKVATKENGE